MSKSVIAPERLTKQPAESRSYSMDFAALLASGETLTGTPTLAHTPVTVPDLTLTVPTISGTTVTFRAASGLVDTVYHVEVLIVTSAANTLEGDGILHCRDD